MKYETKYEVPALSRKSLREYAQYLRKQLGVRTLVFPIVELLEAIGQMGVTYDVISDDEWDQYFGDSEHAEYNLITHTISIRESVYNGAVKGYGRDRFTIAHEIAHALLLDDEDLKVARRVKGKEIPLFCNPEWQADCLAGELLMSHPKCRNMRVEEISTKCKVSIDAARYQKSKF